MSGAELKLEQVSVHSRDLACRYVLVKAGETLSYSIKPQKNSIFYGIYRQANSRKLSDTTCSKNLKAATNSALTISMTFEDRLRQAQLQPVIERLKLPGGKVHKGFLDVESEGMYALVFDNTFSKQKSKLVTFILQIYPTAGDTPSKASDGLMDDEISEPQVFEEHLTGVLMKRRRKKMQGWARRWFVLDFESNTLNYYLNQSSTVLRGAIPLKVAVFSANKESLEFNIDSGAEVWNLRAQSEGAFVMWCQALAASRDSKNEGRTHLAPGFARQTSRTPDIDIKQERSNDAVQTNLWTRLQVVLTEFESVKLTLRDALIQDTTSSVDPVESTSIQVSPVKSRPAEQTRPDTMLNVPKKNFWGKKRNSELAAMSSTTEAVFANAKKSAQQRGTLFGLESQLESALQEFRNILQERNLSTGPKANDLFFPHGLTDYRRTSIGSSMTSDEVWADAESVFGESGFLVAHHDPGSIAETVDDAASDEESDLDEPGSTPEITRSRHANTAAIQFTKDLFPLMHFKHVNISRRDHVPEILDQPPSTLKLMTSKVGSDVSSMSAPAASNEPISLLQRTAEELEYSELLDAAALATHENGSRILHIAAFAVSSFSSMRHKERCRRKPFNPMLGETYELVREDKGFRFIAEKVQHRPLVGVAAHAESSNWTFDQYQATSQKFYGKSMLLTTEGSTTVHLKTGEIYTWEKPELYLKGITWGEKFLEPSGEMVINDLSSGETAIVRFLPSKGWGAGRSEEVSIEAFDAHNKKYENHVTGNWTTQLTMGMNIIWSVGRLVDNPSNRCGLTKFAAQLNEVTEIEKDNLPLTDARLRPDLRAREEGRLEEAEVQKVKVEESQRRRRAEMEKTGQQHAARYFNFVDNKEWVYTTGEADYWSLRERKFQGCDIVDLFAL